MTTDPVEYAWVTGEPPAGLPDAALITAEPG
ncbi:hypothetical protein J3R04_000630 [Spirilliplanes yamanashiensis]|nr:hypothetical protein [Spirilliplanes yamanashiensis]